MDAKHKQILRKNRTKLIENIAKPDDVCDLLFERQIFTESMKQDVEAKNTDIEKIRHILDITPRRGPTAFDALIAVLKDTGNHDAAAILLNGDPNAGSGGAQVGISYPNMGPELPAYWPNEQAMTEPIKVVPCNVYSDLVKYKWLSQDVYSMKKKVRGRCLIISNKTFYGPLEKDKDGKQRVVLTDRHGTEQDEDALLKLFSQLQFDVTVHRDKKAREMLEILEEEAGHIAHGDAECFVCIICSHGTREGIYGVDGGVIRLDGVTKCFDGDNCSALVGKPKLFFIQACQGEDSDIGGNSDTVDAGQDLSTVFSKMTLENTSDANRVPGDVVRARNVPAKIDMLVASATHPGYVSLRNTRYGSWFIQAVVYVFQRFACEKTILELLTLVNKLVSKGRSPHSGTGAGGGEPNQNVAPQGQIMQAAIFQSSLVQDFYFFPGIIQTS